LSQLDNAIANACSGDKGNWKSRLKVFSLTFPNCSLIFPPISVYSTVFKDQLEIFDRRLLHSVVKIQHEGVVIWLADLRSTEEGC
jgi:hypothetical protein